MSEKYEYEKKCFQKDTQEHQMTIALDQGIHRHLRFKNPKHNNYWFDITTWNGYLCISGDMGCFTFSRVNDMLEFFRGDNISPQYWGDKIQAGAGRKLAGITNEWNQSLFNKAVKDYIDNYCCDLSEEDKADLNDRVKNELLGCDGEYESRSAIHNFNNKHIEFVDFYPRCTEFTHHYLWCCYAIVWAIKQYDSFKGEV